MTVYPPAKINIGLWVTEKRPDGFHNIETVFYPIVLHDTLNIEISGTAATGNPDFECTGISLPDSNPADNLCCKAYRLLCNDFGLPPVKIRLHKAIPVGAGLGGGSSDAAYTLQVINDMFHLGIPHSELAGYASRLGSDCAFFLQHAPALGTGKGDILKPVPLSLAGYHFLLVKPPVFVSTADAYSSITPEKPQQHLQKLLQKPLSEWRNAVVNDFEKPVFARFPEIKQIKEKLYSEGAVYASMSGSGSSVYGIFERLPDEVENMFPGCFVWSSPDCKI